MSEDHTEGPIEGRKGEKESDIPASGTFSGVRVGAEDVGCTGAGACAL